MHKYILNFLASSTLMSHSGNLGTLTLVDKLVVALLASCTTCLWLFVCIYIYYNCAHRSFNDQNRHRSTDGNAGANNIVRNSLGDVTASTSNSQSGMLNSKVLASLPVFVFSAMAHEEKFSCSVCLAEFKEGEKGRLLPRCYHSFHVDCIDQWFVSHSTCPVCRDKVELEAPGSDA